MTITKEGSLASFYTVNKAPIKHLKVYFSPKQAGEGDPSPENVREISGWNGLNIKYTGLNIAEFETISDVAHTYYLPKELVNKNLIYSIYIDNTNGATTAKIRAVFRDENGNKLMSISRNSFSAGQKGRDIITIDNAIVLLNTSYIQLGVSGDNIIIKEPMIEFKTQKSIWDYSKYEAYHGQTHTLSWSDTLGTIYGGYIDLVTGEVCEEWLRYTFTTLDGVTFVTGTTYMQCNINPIKLGLVSAVKKDSKLNIISDYCKTDSTATDSFAIYNATNGNIIIRMPNSIVANGNEFRTYIENHNLNVCLKLENPITHQLTPTQLQTFIGQNNIWSNADRVEVEYDLAESNDELYRRRNIILRGYPHIETANGNIASFQTDLAAPVKEAKIYFNPIQIGSGDPSPENIKNINGWQGLNVITSGKNIFYTEWESGSIDGNSGNFISSNTRLRTKDPIKLKIGTRYVINVIAKQSSLKLRTIYIYNDNNAINNYNMIKDSFPFTAIPSSSNNDKSYLNIKMVINYSTDTTVISPSDISGTIIEEIPYDIPTYEPYIGTTVPIDWSSTIGTIYGGYVDLINGEIVENYIVETFTTTGKSSISRTYDTTEDSVYFSLAAQYPFRSQYSSGTEATGISAVGAAPINGLSNYLNIAYVDNWRGTQNINTICRSYTDYTGGFSIRIASSLFDITTNDTETSKATKINNYLASNPLQIGYLLRTPIHHPLTPQILKTFKGTNNIWSDANGPVSITYWTH